LIKNSKLQIKKEEGKMIKKKTKKEG